MKLFYKPNFTVIRRSLFCLVMLFIARCCYSQKMFDLKLSLDSSINPQKISFHYFDGINNKIIEDTFYNWELEFKEKFFSEYASVEFMYNTEGKISYSDVFFINEKPSRISLNFVTGALKYNKLENALPVFDTNSNQLFKKLLSYRKKEAQTLDDFINKNGNTYFTNDSLKLLFAQMYKVYNNKTISFLKENSENYFSFWYFINEVLPPTMAFLGNDTMYIRYLDKSFKTIFPARYVNSPGGKSIAVYLKGLINPYVENEYAPSFTGTGINGDKIKLNDLKGKYVLLDFWASWCGPCMYALPLIKKIRDSYTQDKLEVIGINQDKSFEKLHNAILNKNINWKNIWDEDDAITHLFGVTAIPVTILINKEGLLVYRCTGFNPDNEKQITEILDKGL